MFRNLNTTMDRLRDEELRKKSKFAKDYRANIRGIIYYITYTKKEEIRERFLLKEYSNYCMDIDVTPVINNFIKIAGENNMEDAIAKEINKDLVHTGVSIECFCFNVGKIGTNKIKLRLDLDEISRVVSEDNHKWKLWEWFKR